LINYEGDISSIDKELSWEYENIQLSKIPTKLSVSEIKARYNLEDINNDNIEQMQKEPKFLNSKKSITNAKKGSIMHLIIQHLSLKLNHTVETIHQEVQNMVLKNLLTNEEYKSIDITKIYKFTLSDLYKRMVRSDEVYKEKPFYITVPVKEVYKEVEQDDTILVQGIIDCYFEENGEIVLIDYKTDYVENGNIESLVDKYYIQLNYYKRALENATAKKVKQVYIYSLYCNKEVELF